MYFPCHLLGATCRRCQYDVHDCDLDIVNMVYMFVREIVLMLPLCISVS